MDGLLLGNEDSENPGMGDGTFGYSISYNTHSSPGSVSKGDFNGDGITDLATPNTDNTFIAVLFGNPNPQNPSIGDGTFAYRALIDTEDIPAFITAGDYNGDGITDLITEYGFYGNISLLLGSSTGLFSDPINIDHRRVYRMTNGDFNGDGITDLAALAGGGVQLSVLLGNMDGTFASHSILSVSGSQPRSMTTGDFNGDNILDIATANSGSNNVSVVLGNESTINPHLGDGTFLAHYSYPAGETPQSMTMDDFNSDGIIDIATANFHSKSVSVLLGNGDGTFSNQLQYSTGSMPTSVTTGDFNSDGIIDLATTNVDLGVDTGTVSVLLGNENSGEPGVGNGTFAAPVTSAVGGSPQSVTTGDFNSDGITDLVANTGSDNVSVLLGNGNGGTGDGTFSVQATYAAGLYVQSLTTGDFNGDGIIDLAIASWGTDTVSILLGNGSGGIGDGTFFDTRFFFFAGDGPISLSTGDFNSDGITDLVTANSISDDVSVLLGNGNGGTGDGTFSVQVTYPTGESPASVTTGDFNGDGIIDLAADGYHAVHVLLGNGSGGIGDGTFAPPVTYSAGETPSSVMTGDFNGDGMLDLATANASSDNVSVLLNLGFTGNPYISEQWLIY